MINKCTSNLDSGFMLWSCPPQKKQQQQQNSYWFNISRNFRTFLSSYIGPLCGPTSLNGNESWNATLGQQTQLPPFPIFIALLPLKCSSKNIYFSPVGAFYDKKNLPCPYSNKVSSLQFVSHCLPKSYVIWQQKQMTT